jgi:hypothetical protein
MKLFTFLFVLLAVLLLSSVPVYADIMTIPSGLTPGSTYFLAFVTVGTSQATSTNIADYDNFVTQEANSISALVALGTTWKVIGSTTSVDAKDHISLAGPVYNLNGELVATGAEDLWDGLGNLHPINVTQTGNIYSRGVWTGTNPNGKHSVLGGLAVLESMNHLVGRPMFIAAWHGIHQQIGYHRVVTLGIFRCPCMEFQVP